MKTVGLRKLKNRLSEYVRQVRGGQSVIVTDRGQVVAEIRRSGQVPSGARVDPEVADLVNRGLLVLGAPNAARMYPLLPRLLHSTRSLHLSRSTAS